LAEKKRKHGIKRFEGPEMPMRIPESLSLFPQIIDQEEMHIFSRPVNVSGMGAGSGRGEENDGPTARAKGGHFFIAQRTNVRGTRMGTPWEIKTRWRRRRRSAGYAVGILSWLLARDAVVAGGGEKRRNALEFSRAK
jgi:hypothetical protein